MGKARGYKLVEVVGMSGYKYTNPGGFVRRDGIEYVIARRTPSFVDMSSSDARWSDVVLLSRQGARQLVDTDEVLLTADSSRGLGYEDPRLLPDGSGFTMTLVSGHGYRSWLVEMNKGYRGKRMYPIGPKGPTSKNGYIFTARSGDTIVVCRQCNTKAVQFYRFETEAQAERFCMEDLDPEFWARKLVGNIDVPAWAEGRKGRFQHIGFGTTVSPNIAIIHLARADETGKYYVTAIQQLDDHGVPVGPGEIIAEPAKNLPHGDVPNVIYTMMAWIEGHDLVLWSGHDDTHIVECRVKLPKWATDKLKRI